MTFNTPLAYQSSDQATGLEAFRTRLRAGVGVLALTTAFLMAGCSKPENVVLPNDPAKWDTELAQAVKKLPEEDRKLLAAYMVRAKFGEVFGGKGVPFGTTVGMAIGEQKKWAADQAAKEAEAAALKARLEAARAEARAAVDSAVTVTLVEKREVPRDLDARRYSDYQLLRIGIRNRTDKEIIGVAGRLTFIDVFEKQVGSVPVRMTENIGPGEDAEWQGGRDYNQFMPEHRAIWNLEEGKYKAKFLSEAVIFSDGTSLKVPE